MTLHLSIKSNCNNSSALKLHSTTIMETIVKVAIVLSVATVAAAINVVPDTFQCTSDSPTSDPVFSNTNPPVALTHIFCGEIKNGKAQGYHSRYLANKHSKPGGINHSRCAKTTGKLVCDTGTKLCQKCPFDAPVIETRTLVLTSRKRPTKVNSTNFSLMPGKHNMSWMLHWTSLGCA